MTMNALHWRPPHQDRNHLTPKSQQAYKTIPKNSGIHTLIWKHLTVVYRILQRLQNVSAMVSVKKFILAAPNATIVGHKCTFEGQIPHELKV